MRNTNLRLGSSQLNSQMNLNCAICADQPGNSGSVNTSYAKANVHYTCRPTTFCQASFPRRCAINMELIPTSCYRQSGLAELFQVCVETECKTIFKYFKRVSDLSTAAIRRLSADRLVSRYRYVTGIPCLKSLTGFLV